MLPILLLIFCGLLLLLWVLAPRVTPWADHLTRLHPGLRAKAEWMAPPSVIAQVRLDYATAQEVLMACAASNWGKFAETLDSCTAGPYLAYQRKALASLAQARNPRLAAEFSAEHELTVRHFTADGLRCLLVDRQTKRAVTTSAYWSGRELHCQRLDERTFVFQMVYDPSDKRWKIEKLIQELPLGWGAPTKGGAVKGRVQESARLPVAAGRDN
jgi:hypothetical protein